MPSVREALRVTRKVLGKSGIDFVITLAFYFLFYFTGHSVLALLCFLALIPSAIILLVRGIRYVKRHSLWSVRNRLLFVYGLFGFVPLALLFLLVALCGWALMSELAIYLASSALDRRIEAVRDAADFLHSLPVDQRSAAAEHILNAHTQDFPGVTIYLTDSTGEHRFPVNGPALQIPPEWKTVHGLLFNKGKFYAWAHIAEGVDQHITLIAPLTDQTIANLVPHLGVIALVEPGERQKRKPPVAVGGMHVQATGTYADQDLTFISPGSPDGSQTGHVPPPVNRFDVEVAWPSTRPHYHLDSPGETHPGVLWVQSRPSAVFRSFFSSSEMLRGVLVDVLIGIAILFLLVELVALVIGISLSHRITTAVNQMYEGTRRVIYGDFGHRIPVRVHDQLGELAQSFNQMTGNIERLLVIEKEKERLETELEIAREVQAQLYPKEEPPRAGLQVSARCDPARMVSGDYYDYQALVQGKIAFAIGDIAGKGISAALLMATLQAAMRAQVSQSAGVASESGVCVDVDPAALVSKLNQQIYAHTSPEKYATFFFALYDESSRSLTYTNAGHLSPLLFRNGSVAPLDSNGTVVGAFPFSQYGESTLTFEPRDLLVCYTDGITEPENAYGEMFGEERLIDLVKRNVHLDDHEIIRIIFEAVRGWTGTPELQDDMTLLLARQVQPA